MFREWNTSSIGVIARLRLLLDAVNRIKWALADQFVVSGCNFLSNIMLARILGITEFGHYVLAWAIVVFVQSIQYSAISTSMLSIGPKHDSIAAQSYFGAMFLHQAIFGLVSAILTLVGGYIAAFFFPASGLDLMVLPLAAAVLCSQAQDFLRRYFFSVDRPKVSFAIDACRYIGQIVAILSLTSWLPASGVMALWLIAATALLGSLAALPCIPELKYSLSVTISTGLRGWHFSKWLIASTLLVMAVGNLFYFSSAILLGAAAVGAMRAASNVVGIANVIIEAAVNVIPARAAREFTSGGRDGLIKYLTKVAIYGTIAAASVLGVFVIAPRFWIHFFFGPEFESYWVLVPWSAAIQIVIFLGLVVGTWYRTFENTRFILYANGFSAIVSLAVAYPLIISFGVTGAVIGTLCGQLAQLVFMLMAARLAEPR
jgi:O-antigen/teichoic acid export membrane protein